MRIATANKKSPSRPKATTVALQLPMHELVLNHIRLLAARRIAWLRKLWSEAEKKDSGIESNSHAEVDGLLNNMDRPETEMAWQKTDKAALSWAEEIRKTGSAILKDQGSRLNTLRNLFNLQQQETDVVEACLAIAAEPNIGRLYAYLQDHSGRSFVTTELVARLFGHGRFLTLSSSSSLKIWKLISETETVRGEAVRLTLDPFIRNWLLGIKDTDEILAGIGSIQPCYEPLTDWPVNETVEFVKSTLKRIPSGRIRIFIAGPEGSGRRSMAAAISNRLKKDLLTIDSDRISENQWPQAFMHAQRLALLNNYSLAWRGTAIHNRYWPDHITSAPVQFIIGEKDERTLPAANIIDRRIELPALSFDQCRQLWIQHVPAAKNWPGLALDEMIRRHQIHIGHIADAASNGISKIEDASERLRFFSRTRLGNLAQQLRSEFTRDDLVVSDFLQKGLDDFTFEAKERSQMWSRPEMLRLFPYGRGLIALFTGSPGTGKTMAAQVIANGLQLDIFRIDLSTVVSKYVGETSKNLERILSRAENMDVVLFFDEADALFGKRTEIKDAHDRFANTDTNYLLQAIEQYPGIAILSSNKKNNIDAGFTRRLRYVFEFSKPDANQRQHLWNSILKELTTNMPSVIRDDDIARLAETIELTGAQIKFSILSALFIAGKEKKKLSISHVLQGLERELVKEGRGLGRQIKDLFKNAES